MMKTTFTIAGNLAIVSLFGIANVGYAQTGKPDFSATPTHQATSIVVKANPAKDGTYDVEITENGKTRKLTGLKPGPKGLIELPAGPNGEATVVIDPARKVEGKPPVPPGGAAATQVQAQSRDVSIKASSDGSGTFDIEITENGKTRKLKGVQRKADGTFDIPELVDIKGVRKNKGKPDEVRILHDLPLIFPSGAAAAQAQSQSVSVKAIGNGSGTFDVEITENGKTRKLTGLKPGPKGKIEVPSGAAGHPPIVIDTTDGPHGNVSVRVEGKPLILPSGSAAQVQAQSQSVSVKAVGNGSGTFDVEITENGKTRKLTGVKAKADGSLDIPELNSDAPKGAKVEKQVKIITVDGSTSGIAVPDITDIVDLKSGDAAIDVTALPNISFAPGSAVTVTTDGKAPAIVKSGRIVSRDITSGIGVVNGQDVMLLEAVPNAGKVSKEVIVEAKFVNGKKVVASPKMTVLSGQHAKIQVGDIWLSLYATVSPSGTISLKGDAGSAKTTKGPGFSVSGLASGGSFTYPNGNAGTWEIKASVSGTEPKSRFSTFSIPLRKP
ncbi:MAG: hypothetical protein ACKO14_05695 [Armatimonadota bacterium]